MIPESIAVEFRQACDSCSPQRWVIALSGGLDSICLLHLSHLILPSERLHVLHVNHNLQAESSAWAAFCAEQAAKLGIAYTQLDVFPESDSENAARDARYQAFAGFLHASDVLLVAHHADDQAETLLFRLLRGSGLKGLGGMPTSRRLGQASLLRPLLSIERSALESWAKSSALQWINDPSNQDDHYARNFLRLNVLPLLQTRWSGLAGRLAHTANLLSNDQALLDEYLDQDLQAYVKAPKRLDFSGWHALAEVKQLALLRRWLQTETKQLCSSDELQRIRREVILAREGRQPEMTLGGHLDGYCLRRYRKNLYLCFQYQAVKFQHGSSNLPLQSGVHNLKGGMLQVNQTDQGRAVSLPSAIANQAVFCRLQDWLANTDQTSVRVKPANRPTKTLKKLFQEAGIPPWQRADWPLLILPRSENNSLQGEILAIPSLCICEGWQETSAQKSDFFIDWQPI